MSFDMKIPVEITQIIHTGDTWDLNGRLNPGRFSLLLLYTFGVLKPFQQKIETVPNASGTAFYFLAQLIAITSHFTSSVHF